MHLKESAYNFIYDDLGKDQIVFYNSRTGALAVVHEDQYKQYKGFQEKGKEIEDTSTPISGWLFHTMERMRLINVLQMNSIQNTTCIL